MAPRSGKWIDPKRERTLERVRINFPIGVEHAAERQGGRSHAGEAVIFSISALN
jgi:hypothetical protein